MHLELIVYLVLIAKHFKKINLIEHLEAQKNVYGRTEYQRESEPYIYKVQHTLILLVESFVVLFKSIVYQVTK